MQFSLLTILTICAHVTALPEFPGHDGKCDQAACERGAHESGWPNHTYTSWCTSTITATVTSTDVVTNTDTITNTDIVTSTCTVTTTDTVSVTTTCTQTAITTGGWGHLGTGKW